jgi:hypothetical protein
MGGVREHGVGKKSHESRWGMGFLHYTGLLHAGQIQFWNRNEISFSNDICAASLAHPNLVKPLRVNVEPGARPKCFLLWLRVVWISDCQFAVKDQMRGQAIVSVWRIISVPETRLVSCFSHRLIYSAGIRSISPSEDMAEAP